MDDVIAYTDKLPEGVSLVTMSGNAYADRVLTLPNESVAYADEISISKHRCLELHKLDPETASAVRVLTPLELREVRDPVDSLVSMADRILDNLCKQVAPAGYLVMLTNPQGITLTTRITENVQELRRWGLWSGSVWSEECEGTNGISLCLTEQRPVTVHREEHFRKRYAGLSCTFTPMFDPRGKFTGTLGIASCRRDLDRVVASFARTASNHAARHIEEVCFKNEFRKNWIVSIGHSDSENALLAFDDDRRLVGASRLARLSLGLEETQLEKGIEIDTADFENLFPGVPNVSLDHAARVLKIGRAAIFLPPTERAIRVHPAAYTRSLDIRSLAGDDPSLSESLRRVAATAALNLPLMIAGETGAGKEYVARAVHTSSLGECKPFITIDCGALSEARIDQELFGYAANDSLAHSLRSMGKIASANGGTLFLDEVGDVPLHLQTKLLHVLNNRDSQNGGDQTIPPSFKVICATQYNLEEMVAAGSFRSDLYHRLRGVFLRLPPLRERDDKAALVASILQSIDPRVRLSEKALSLIDAYDWPGNLRELRQKLQVGAAICRDFCIEPRDLDLPSGIVRSVSHQSNAADAIELVEKEIISKQLAENQFDVVRTAKILGMSRATLYRRIKHYGL